MDRFAFGRIHPGWVETHGTGGQGSSEKTIVIGHMTTAVLMGKTESDISESQQSLVIDWGEGEGAVGWVYDPMDGTGGGPGG